MFWNKKVTRVCNIGLDAFYRIWDGIHGANLNRHNESLPDSKTSGACYGNPVCHAANTCFINLEREFCSSGSCYDVTLEISAGSDR